MDSRYVLALYVPDPFADAAKGDEESVQDGLVHIRIQQRNGRKTLTTIQGLSAEYDLKKIVRACKKVRPLNLGTSHIAILELVLLISDVKIRSVIVLGICL